MIPDIGKPEHVGSLAALDPPAPRQVDHRREGASLELQMQIILFTPRFLEVFTNSADALLWFEMLHFCGNIASPLQSFVL